MRKRKLTSCIKLKIRDDRLSILRNLHRPRFSRCFLVVSIINQIQLKLIIKVRCKSCSHCREESKSVSVRN